MATFVRNRLEHIQADDVEPEAILQSSLELGDDYDNSVMKNGAIDVLSHILAARFRGHLTNTRHVPRPKNLAVRYVGAKWDTTSLDEYAIRQQCGVEFDHVREPSRIKPYGPLSKINADDLNAIQDAILFGSTTGYGVSAEPGAEWMAFDAVCNPDGSSVSLDQTIDWRDRLAIVFVRWMLDTDIRPGQVADTSFNTWSEKSLALVYFGSGGDTTGYEYAITSNVLMYALPPTTGYLRIKNNLTSPGNYFYCAGLVIGTQPLGLI